MRSWRALPLFVVLMGIVSVAMMLPVLHGVASRDWLSARAFFYSALLWGIVTTLLAIATHGHKVRNAARAQLLTLVGAFTILPVMMALPMIVAVPATTFFNTWVEMVSSLTTTGATFFDADRLPETVHLWRALVGWMGGFFMWVVAIAILAPLNLGGFEVTSGADVGAGARVDRVRGQRDAEETRLRMVSATQTFAPIYSGLTLILWLGLIIAGDTPFLALTHAMSTMATSGISATDGFLDGGSGVVGEVLILVFLSFAISRGTFSRDNMHTGGWEPLRDPEIRVALSLITIIPGLLFLRHWIGAFEGDLVADFGAALAALWGSVFTVTSFLTTTGFVSAEWDTARSWSGIQSPGIALLGLALAGGGVATTAGGVKLLRIYALYKHGQREVNRLIYPNSVGGKGPLARRIRGQGAYVAWIFFMLFALSFAAVASLLAMTGVDFEEAQILAIASLANCGPLAAEVLPYAIDYGTLNNDANFWCHWRWFWGAWKPSQLSRFSIRCSGAPDLSSLLQVQKSCLRAPV